MRRLPQIIAVLVVELCIAITQSGISSFSRITASQNCVVTHHSGLSYPVRDKRDYHALRLLPRGGRDDEWDFVAVMRESNSDSLGRE
jgi:hypothetical protein